MANKTANILVRIEPELKTEAETILSSLGLTASSAINLFYRQIVLNNGLPFGVNYPKHLDINQMTKEELESSLKEALEDVKDGRLYSVEEVHKELKKKFNNDL